jgi:hypothetical protein
VADNIDFCTQARRGGALYYNNSNPLIFQSQFVSNEADDGAGVVRTSTKHREQWRARAPLRFAHAIVLLRQADGCSWP